MKLLCASESWRSVEIAAYLIRRSRLALGPFGPAPRGLFSSLPVARDCCRSTILSRNSAFYRVLPLHDAFRPFAECASHGVLDFPSAPSDSPATSPEISLPGTRPRLRFLTVLASLHPAIPFQAYFILEALLGFSLQGVPLRRSALGSSPRAPLLSFPRWPPFLCASA